MMVASLRKMNPERKIRLWTAAEKFIEKVTYLP
jgi:hypothetical protein